MEIALKKAPFELDGKVFKLSLNMNVLSELQKAFNGDMADTIIRGSSIDVILTILAAMLNDYADEMGWDERYSPKQLGRSLNIVDINKVTDIVLEMIGNAEVINK